MNPIPVLAVGLFTVVVWSVVVFWFAWRLTSLERKEANTNVLVNAMAEAYGEPVVEVKRKLDAQLAEIKQRRSSDWWGIQWR